MRSGQLVGGLILRNLDHGPRRRKYIVRSIDADLIGPQLVKVSWVVRHLWLRRWSLPINDFFSDVAKGVGMVLEDDTISHLESPANLLHPFELLHYCSHQILHTVVQEML